MRKLLLFSILILCFPFSLNAAQETLNNVVGDCIEDTANEIGCSDPFGDAGNPNDLIECYNNATLTPPYELVAFTYTIGTSTLPPDTLNIRVFEWGGAGPPGALVTTVPLGPGDMTPGFHNLVLASPIALPTPDFCVGLFSEPLDDGFRALTSIGPYTPGTSWVRAPECGTPDFVELADLGFPQNWCYTATIEESVIEVDIDIKFCSDPNAFNCKKNGVLPVTIFGTETFDVYSIDPATLKLCLADLTTCTGAPRGWSVYDRGSPADVGAYECLILDGEEMDYLNPDGWLDLDAAFEASEVIAILGRFCDMPKDTVSQTLFLVGKTYDGTEIFSPPEDDPGVDQLVKKNR